MDTPSRQLGTTSMHQTWFSGEREYYTSHQIRIIADQLLHRDSIMKKMSSLFKEIVALKRIVFSLFLVFTASFHLPAQEKPKTEVKIEQLASNLYLVEFGWPSRMILSVGEDGILIVDTSLKEEFPTVYEAIREKFGDRTFKYFVNTHFHDDHMGGDSLLIQKGVVGIMHSEMKRHLTEWYFNEKTGKKTRDHKEEDFPVLTFSENMNLYFNGEKIQLTHPPNAHTNADVMVFFTESNVLALGDLYFGNAYNYIDFYNGGSPQGEIKALETALDLMDENTVVIPGHGVKSNKEEVSEYLAMFKTIFAQMKVEIDRGRSLEQVKADSSLTMLYDEKYGKFFCEPEYFRELLYRGYENSVIEIPDSKFKEALLSSKVMDSNEDGTFDSPVDSDGDGEIQASEAANVTRLDVSNLGITSLEGISNFKNLRQLMCNNNKLSTVDLSELTELLVLQCYANQLEGLDLKSNTKLKVVMCAYNKIRSIDLSNNLELTDFYISQNPITSIDFSHNKKLRTISFHTCPISSIDLSALSELEHLYVYESNLTKLDLARHPKLKTFECYDSNFKKLDLSSNLELEWLDCSKNQLSELHISKNLKLERLNVSNNELSELDLGLNTNLKSLDCSNNELLSLNIRNGSKLSSIKRDYDDIEFEPLNFDGNFALEFVCADENEFDDINDLIGKYKYRNTSVTCPN